MVRQMYLFTQDVLRKTMFFNAAATLLHFHDQPLHMKQRVLRYRQILTDFKSSYICKHSFIESHTSKKVHRKPFEPPTTPLYWQRKAESHSFPTTVSLLV